MEEFVLWLVISTGDLYSGWRYHVPDEWFVLYSGRLVWLVTTYITNIEGVVRVVAVEIIDWVDGQPLWLVTS